MGSSEQNESLPPPNPHQVSLAAEIRRPTGLLRGKSYSILEGREKT